MNRSKFLFFITAVSCLIEVYLAVNGEDYQPDNVPIDLSHVFQFSQKQYRVLEGGILNISFDFIKQSEGVEEYLYLTQSAFEDINMSMCYVIHHYTKFFSATLISDLYIDFFKFLDAGKKHLTVYDVSLKFSGKFLAQFNIHYDEDLGHIFSSPIIVYPSFDKFIYSDISQKYGLSFDDTKFIYNFAQGIVIPLKTFTIDSYDVRFIYIFNQYDYFEKISLLELEKDKQVLIVSDENPVLTFINRTIYLHNHNKIFHFQIGIEIEREENINTVSTSGFFIPKDFPFIESNFIDFVTFDFVSYFNIGSYQIYLGHESSLCVEQVGSCIVKNGVNCSLEEKDFFKIKLLTKNSIRMAFKNYYGVYIRFQICTKAQKPYCIMTDWKHIFGTKTSRSIILKESYGIKNEDEKIVQCATIEKEDNLPTMTKYPDTSPSIEPEHGLSTPTKDKEKIPELEDEKDGIPSGDRKLTRTKEKRNYKYIVVVLVCLLIPLLIVVIIASAFYLKLYYLVTFGDIVQNKIKKQEFKLSEIDGNLKTNK